MKKIGVLVSGNGSNLQALLEACKKENWDAEFAVVISNKPAVYALERAALFDVTTMYLSEEGKSREEYDREIMQVLSDHEVDLVLLAGYMKVLTPEFVNAYAGRIMNIHPSLLPSFPGLHAQKQAFDAGVKLTGATVHFVDTGLDTGPIIIQSPAIVDENDTAESLQERILRVEHWIYPKAVALYLAGKLKIEGNKVKIDWGDKGAQN